MHGSSAWRVALMTLACGLVPALSGCSAGYLFHLGIGQARILWDREPVRKVLENGCLAAPQKAKLELVLEAKEFGEGRLGLTPSKNYTYYVQVRAPAVAYNLTACPALDLEPHQWCFPIAGCLPYKGYFDRDRGLAEMKRMQEEGYDTYLRSVAGYSTLGWFVDPVFSTMLRHDETELVEIVLHEMVHRTVFLKDQGAFNEGLATFLGERGTRAFFLERGGEGRKGLQRIEAGGQDQERFQSALHALAERLRELYGSSLSEPEKRREKERIFEEARSSFRGQLSEFHRPGYARVLERTWNNAFVASFLTYHQDLGIFEALLERLGGDLNAFIERMKALQQDEEKDPHGRIRKWIEGHA
ncbi:MAG: aminopeptidase [bacterium]